MTSCSLTPNHVIIWLDQHIGILESNNLLKSAVGRQADPHNATPTSPNEPDVGNLIRFREAMGKSFFNIPENLKTFHQIETCLQCIGESIVNQKEIFFITSGTMGRHILPQIAQMYPSLKKIYLFCGYYQAHTEWAFDYLDKGFNIIMENLHTDLLVRLVRDVADYFISEGDRQMPPNPLLASSTAVYFGWAKVLLDRANDLATRKVINRLQYAENRIKAAEKIIKETSKDDEDKISSEPYP